jgi:hypothetical protein
MRDQWYGFEALATGAQVAVTKPKFAGLFSPPVQPRESQNTLSAI